MTEKQNKMANMPMNKLVFSMSIPLMVSLLVQSLYNIVDSIFVAKISVEALTATSLSFPIQMLMIAFSVGTSVGMNALLSRTLGARNAEKATKIADTGMILALIGASVFTIGGLFFSRQLAHLFTDHDSTALLCQTYLHICMSFCVGNFVETMAQRYLQASGRTALSMCSLVAGAGTNLILDPILIFGYFGFQSMGIRGAAIATVIGQWVGAAVALILNHFCNPEVKLNFRGFRLEREIVAGIYKVGFPNILTQAMGSLMVTSVNRILLPISSNAVAFFGVYYKLQNFLFMPMNGLGQAAIPIMGFNLGAKNPRRIRSCLKCVVPGTITIALIGTAVFQLLPRQLLMLFSANEDMLTIGVPALRIISCSFALGAATLSMGYCASGLGYGITTMASAFLRQLVVLVPGFWLLSRIGGVSLVWYAIWIAELAAVVFAFFSLRRLLNRKVRPLEGESMAESRMAK